MIRRAFVAASPVLAFGLVFVVVVGAAVACFRGGGAPAIVTPGVSAMGVAPPGAGAAAIVESGFGAFVLTAVRTLGLAGVVSALSVALAIPAAWGLRGRSGVLTLVVLTPMVLPQYLVYAAWGVARAPGTVLGDWLMRVAHDGAGGAMVWDVARWVQTVLGMALWAWPLAVLVLVPAVMRVDASVLDALRLSGASRVRRGWVVLGQVRPAVIAAIALVSLVMLGSAVPVHVAQIETWAIGVWRALAESGGGAAAWRAGTPLMLITGVAGAVMAWRLVGAETDMDEPAEVRLPAPAWPLVLVWGASVVVPAVLLAMHLKQASSLRRFWAESGEPVWFSAQVGLAVGAVCVLVSVSTALGFAGSSRSVRRIAGLAVAVWAAMAAVPGVLVGSAVLSAAMHVPGLSWLADTSGGLIAAHVARFGVVGALAGWWVARSEPVSLRDTRMMMGDSLWGWWSGVVRGGGVLGVIGCAGLAGGMLSVHEIEAGVVVSPPGVRTLSQHMLNLLHYLRDEQLTAGSLWMLGGGAIAAGAGVVMLRGGSRAVGVMKSAAPLLLLAVVVACGVGGCSRGTDASAEEPLPGAVVIGEPGRLPGQFSKPRCIDTDGRRLFVIDMTGRCQVLSLAGKAQAWWSMPSIDRGKPTGVTWFAGFGSGAMLNGVAGPQVLVADSHENRVASYVVPESGLESMLLPIAWQWGEYGTGKGHFVFPSDVLAVDAAHIYVSEYGGNDRVSVFSADGSLVRTFGSEGDSEDAANVQFRRPQSLLWDAPSRTLVVADACNHRLGLFTAGGELKKWIGRSGAMPGRGLGEFHYPFGLCQLEDGTVLVAEQGNARVQRVDVRGGKGIAVYGRRGRGVGELDSPWGVCAVGDVAYICDAGNHRLQSFVVPAVSGYPWPAVSERSGLNGETLSEARKK